MRKIVVFNGKLNLSDDVEVVFEKTVTKFGTGAKLDCPKEHMDKQAYILIIKRNGKKRQKTK
ncbi:DUF2080 family transposase-associated protein [Candidatus Micrarchaeota archaeon]|nr:DUF2080 family transposase-associated protein [Candidatus Micrarchaeota archaeon]